MAKGTRWTSRMGAGLGSALKLSDWGMRQTWWVEPSALAREPVRLRFGGARHWRRDAGAEGRPRRAA